MKRRGVAATTTITALLLSGMMAPAASAGTPSWLKVRTASKATAYNGGRVTVVPKVAAGGQRTITSLRLTAYRGSKRAGSGKTVRLKPGTYKTITSGTYRAYRLVNQTRTRQVLHEGSYASATCRVYSAENAGFGDETTHSYARCTNGYYPRQPQSDESYANYQVGDTYSYSFYFDSEYVSQRYVAKVRSYGRTQKFSSAKRSLRVRNGGYRKVFSGSGGVDTNNFRPPGKSWRISYNFSCGEWTNFVIWLHRANGELVDLVANELDTSGSGSVRENGGGKYYLEVETDSSCSWRVSIK